MTPDQASHLIEQLAPGRTPIGEIVARLVHAGLLPDREAGHALIRGSRERQA